MCLEAFGRKEALLTGRLQPRILFIVRMAMPVGKKNKNHERKVSIMEFMPMSWIDRVKIANLKYIVFCLWYWEIKNL